MKKITSLLFFVFIPLCSYSQIDTTDWFPMQTGNYWEYWDNSGSGSKLYVTIAGETVLDNGHSYKIFRYRGNNWLDSTDYYFREVDDCKVYFYYGAVGCTNKEQLLYDFCLEDSVLWPSCLGYLPDIQWFRTVLLTNNIYLPLLQNSVISKLFSDVVIDTAIVPNDTSWFAGGLEKIAKGIGKYESLFDQSPWYYLVGAIINGETYGIITDVNLQGIQPTEFQLHQNYPNPFNPVTTISWQTPVSGWQTIKIYNSLGEEIKTLVDEYKPAGMHKVQFTNNNLPSGVYFYQVRAGEFVQIKKMILMK